jgi:hypothetical protein
MGRRRHRKVVHSNEVGRQSDDRREDGQGMGIDGGGKTKT